VGERAEARKVVAGRQSGGLVHHQFQVLAAIDFGMVLR
jgi:hypothetical protein